MTRRSNLWLRWVLMAGFAIAIASAGCATGPVFVAPEPPASGRAVVYVYRANSIFGAGVKPALWIDARQVGAMLNGGYQRFEVVPGGIWTTSVASPDCRPTTAMVAPAAGTAAYVQVELTNRTFELGGRHYFDYGAVPCLAACKQVRNSEETSMYKLEDVAGVNVDRKSEYAKHWPGEAALFKLSSKMTLAIPPVYQEFWLQGDKVTRTPAPREAAPEVPRIGFDFFMPGFGGYTPDNYRQPFHEDRVQVVYLEAVAPRGDGQAPIHSDVDGAIKRLSGIELIPDHFEDKFGLRCFASPMPTNSRRTCVGERLPGERMLLSILVPPYAPGIAHPVMQTTYYTGVYGGMQVTWRAHMKHFAQWLDIDRQIWKFVEAWNIAK